MKIAVDRTKLKRRIVLHGLLFTFFFGNVILVIYFNMGTPEAENIKTLLLCLILVIIAFVSGIPILHLLRVRKEFQHIIRFDNGILTDYSGILNYKKKISIENIMSVSCVELNTKIGSSHQIILKLRVPEKTGFSVLNQINGHKIYITDYVVKTRELMNLATILDGLIKKY